MGGHLLSRQERGVSLEEEGYRDPSIRTNWYSLVDVSCPR